MPGSRASGGYSGPTAARASAWPATVSWSVSATTSSPARAARRITSAGGSVPSEALLCTCRSARIKGAASKGQRSSGSVQGAVLGTASPGGQARRGGPEGQVQVLAGISQVTQGERLHEQGARGVRPQHDPQPPALHLAGEHGAV